ncbi:MAG: chemotaxis protein CheW [Gemmatimonadaceae bacterium]|nr:chemotaxis protein CheW [Gemmatimonadaceae bacterium]
MADDQRPLWLVVRSQGQRLGIPIAQVREVVRPTGLRRVPGAPVVQAGIVNVRGAIVTVLDLALRSASDAGRVAASGPRAVVAGSIVLLQYGSRPIGIAVDGVEDVAVAEDDSDDARSVHPFDAVAWCARHLHSAEERER